MFSSAGGTSEAVYGCSAANAMNFRGLGSARPALRFPFTAFSISISLVAVASFCLLLCLVDARKQKKSSATGHHRGIKFSANTTIRFEAQRRSFAAETGGELSGGKMHSPIIYWKINLKSFARVKLAQFAVKQNRHTHTYTDTADTTGTIHAVELISFYCFVSWNTRSTLQPKRVERARDGS